MLSPLVLILEGALSPSVFIFVNWSGTVLTGAAVVHGAAHYGFIYIHIAVPDFQVVTAIRVGANPCFVVNIRPLAAEIGQGYRSPDLHL